MNTFRKSNKRRKRNQRFGLNFPLGEANFKNTEAVVTLSLQDRHTTSGMQTLFLMKIGFGLSLIM
jgi:hypothetical protein